jgi:benzodiazapine receptor
MKSVRLIVSLILPQLAGFLGSFFTVASIPVWYATLNKPSFNPPNWVFGPTWFLLYLMMGISVYLVWNEFKKGKDVKKELTIFWIHLFLNATWTPLFFGLKNLGLAFVNIVLIWGLIIYLIIKFWKIRKASAILLIPYLGWVTFASALNLSIWLLN